MAPATFLLQLTVAGDVVTVVTGAFVAAANGGSADDCVVWPGRVKSAHSIR